MAAPDLNALDQVYLEANTFLERGDYPQAIRLYTDVIKMAGENPRANVYLSYRSEANLKHGNLQSALRDANMSLGLSETNRAHRWKGESLMRLGRYSDAALAFGAGLRTYPGSAVLSKGLTMARRHLGHDHEEKKSEENFDVMSHDSSYERRPSDGLLPSPQILPVAPSYGFMEQDPLPVDSEENLYSFVAKINQIYEEKLSKPAPFMTFVLVGLQSVGKSSLVERFMKAVISVVQDGTGTRCPLDVTLIHDSRRDAPNCSLSGNDLETARDTTNISGSDAFEIITAHNQKLENADCFSIEPLRLVYRANNVQNMRFVDTPGLILNKSTGNDNRRAIKNILLNELSKPNAMLCVLLEPKEFATNSVVDFIDESVGGRDKWLPRAIFVMSKFDKQTKDLSSGSRANAFFHEYRRNNIRPYLVMADRLRRDKLQPRQLYEQRRKLLENSVAYEQREFQQWQAQLEDFKRRVSDEESLNEDTVKRIGINQVSNMMRQILVEDTLRRLPEVIASIHSEQKLCADSISALEERRNLQDPERLKKCVNDMARLMQKRIQEYISGDLEVVRQFPEWRQTLLNEIQEEETSDWYVKDFNHYKEDDFRFRLEEYKESFPAELQAERLMFGGAQIQRAFELFQILMIESLPDPSDLGEDIFAIVGVANNNIMRPDYDRALGQIARTLMKESLHPGINVLVKVTGLTFRRFARVAMMQIKANGDHSHLHHIPQNVEEEVLSVFNEKLWDLLNDACEKLQTAIKPLYSTIDPNLPTFQQQGQRGQANNGSVDPKEGGDEELVNTTLQVAASVVAGNMGGAKAALKDKICRQLSKRTSIFPDARASTTTDDEAAMVVEVASKYLVALMEFIPTVLRLHFHKYILEDFKDFVEGTFMREIWRKEWNDFVHFDPTDEKEMEMLKEKEKGLKESLIEIRKLRG